MSTAINNAAEAPYFEFINTAIADTPTMPPNK